MVSYDVVVIGAGPGGYVTAIRAKQLGLKTAVVEASDLGGVCLNWGCIPTKCLLESAKQYTSLKQMKLRGIHVQDVSLHPEEMFAYSRSVVSQLTRGIAGLLKKHEIPVYRGFGSLLPKADNHRISVLQEGQDAVYLEAKNVILATGARPRLLSHLDSPWTWTYKQALAPDTLPHLPKRLAIVGAGVIGLEFASFFHALGCEVRVIEQNAQILATEDREIVQEAQKIFEKKGIQFHLNSGVTIAETLENGLRLAIAQNGSTTSELWECDRLLLAVGVVPNSEQLGLEHTKVKVERGVIQTDAFSETAEPGLYAIGDVASPPWLAHKASKEGILCVEKIAGKTIKPLQFDRIPSCIYTHPQIARVGLTEEEARVEAESKGFSLQIGRFPYKASGKALALGKPEGLVKVILNQETGEFLGAHLLGEEATELLGAFLIAQVGEVDDHTFMEAIFPHPTLSEMLPEAIEDAHDLCIHYGH